MTTEKTLAALEFKIIMDMLKEYAHNAVAVEMADELRPSGDFAEVQRLCEQTDEAVRLLLKKNFPSTAALVDVSAALGRVQKAGVLSLGDIFDCGNLLRITTEVSRFFRDEEPAVLCEFTSQLTPLKELEKDIAGAFVSREVLADGASSALADIRRKVRNLHVKIKRDLDAYVRKAETQKHLQEAIITVRNGRYVLPVKAEAKSSIKGIVHDSSGTGSTLFIEPNFIVEMNNEISRQLVLEEEEIRRIVADFSMRIAEEAGAFAANFNAVSNLDFIFAKARFAIGMKAVKPRLNNEGRIDIISGRHPLLEPATAVPIDISLGGDVRTLVITGPNTGGKTVALKTVGLFCVMVACGLQIPVQSDSEIAVFDGVYADIGDEQSIQQSLSTFSAHMTNIVGIVGELTANSLVLFDELGAGTDPDEGAALAIAILEHVKSRGAMAMATTHYSQMKLYGMSTDGVQNAGCDFDVKTLRPTYKLLVGVPGKSNAFAISANLGLPAEIIESARNQLDSSNIKFEDAVRELHGKSRELSEVAEAKEGDAREVRRLKEELERKLAGQKADFSKERDAAKREAKAIIDSARREAEAIIKDLNRDKDVIKARTRLNKESEKVESKLEIPAELFAPNRVSFGGATHQAGGTNLRMQGGSSEIDLRGYRLDDAVYESEMFIDNAVVRGLGSVVIIHGKGTGALRAGIHKMLKGNSQVKGFRLGTFGEGESGVTIVDLGGGE